MLIAVTIKSTADERFSGVIEALVQEVCLSFGAVSDPIGGGCEIGGESELPADNDFHIEGDPERLIALVDRLRVASGRPVAVVEF